MSESSIKEEVAMHLARNEKLLELIDEHGADVNHVGQIDFFFYASDKSAARGLARDLETAGFVAVHVSDEPIDGKWSIQAMRADSISAITCVQFVEQVACLAAKYLAEFDGWGTSI